MKRPAALVALSLLFMLAAACRSGTTSKPGATRTTTAPGSNATAARTAATVTLPTAPASPTPGPDDGLARSLLLTSADFPSDWSEQPPQGTKLSAQCGGASAGGTGYTTTGDFGQPGSVSVFEQVMIFDTAQRASASLGNWQSVADCIVKLINDGNVRNARAVLSNASSSRLSFPASGDRTEALRVQFLVTTKGSATVTRSEVFLDLISVATGRAAFTVEVTHASTAYGSAELEPLVSKAASKAQQGIAR